MQSTVNLKTLDSDVTCHTNKLDDTVDVTKTDRTDESGTVKRSFCLGGADRTYCNDILKITDGGGSLNYQNGVAEIKHLQDEKSVNGTKEENVE